MRVVLFGERCKETTGRNTKKIPQKGWFSEGLE